MRIMENLTQHRRPSQFGNSYHIDDYDAGLRDSDIDYFLERGYHYRQSSTPLHTPLNTPPMTPPRLSPNVSEDSRQELPTLERQRSPNDDLYDEHFNRVMDEIILRIPLEDRLSMDGLDDLYEDFNNYPDAEGYSQMKVPYLLLEFVACVCFDFAVCGTVFISAFIAPDASNKNGTEQFFWQAQTKLLNFLALAMIGFMFIGPDTYKAINITLEFLAINAIVYEYSFDHAFRYFVVNIVAGVVASLAAIGIYQDLIANVPVDKILTEIITEFHSMKIGASYILIAIITHFSIAIGLTILTNLTSSVNARKSAIYKVTFLIIISLTIGVPIDPIGHLWPNLILYFMVCITRLEFPAFDITLFVAYALTLVAITVAYPMIAMQIKFTWKNKYRRYIEYVD